MADYRRILVAIDLTDDSERVIDRAQSIARQSGARVQLLHVVEFVPVEPMGDALLPAVQIEESLIESAKRKLGDLAARKGIPAGDWAVYAGNIKAEIVRVAQEGGVDLVVLGSRGRHGLSILVNFTEDTVLHAAPCDVLAVRLQR